MGAKISGKSRGDGKRTIPADCRRSNGHTLQGDGLCSSRLGTGRRIQRMIEILRSSALGEVPHGFLGRRGGVSIGIYDGLNVGLGRSEEHTSELQSLMRIS